MLTVWQIRLKPPSGRPDSGRVLVGWMGVLLVSGFVEFNSSVHVVMAKLQHPVDQAGKCVCHRGTGFGRAEFGITSGLRV
jgi:hypothetical protein